MIPTLLEFVIVTFTLTVFGSTLPFGSTSRATVPGVTANVIARAFAPTCTPRESEPVTLPPEAVFAEASSEKCAEPALTALIVKLNDFDALAASENPVVPAGFDLTTAAGLVVVRPAPRLTEVRREDPAVTVALILTVSPIPRAADPASESLTVIDPVAARAAV